MSRGIIKQVSKRLGSLTLTILIVVLDVFLPLLVPKIVLAASSQLTSRSVTISSGIPGQTSVTYTYGFTTINTQNIGSIQFKACTTALGAAGSATCTAPTGMNINQGSEASRSGWTGSNTFTRDAVGGNDCTPANNVLCVKRTAQSETLGARTLGWNTQTNPTTANSSFFIMIKMYSDNAWTAGNLGDFGVVASAVVQTLTVNATVDEVLQFCVGSTQTDTGSGTVTNSTGGTMNDCSNVSGTSLNIGTLDSTNVNVSPVASGTSGGGDGLNGLVMLRTNAQGGATISYDAIQDVSGAADNHKGTLKVQGKSCNAGNVNTDECIDAKGATQGTLAAATENFGMTVAAVNCSAGSAGEGYACTFAGGTYHLTRNTNYDGTGANTYPTDSGQVAGTTNAGYAWVEDGTVTQIASSTGGANPQSRVVDDEALILKFAATPSIVT